MSNLVTFYVRAWNGPMLPLHQCALCKTEIVCINLKGTAMHCIKEHRLNSLQTKHKYLCWIAAF